MTTADTRVAVSRPPAGAPSARTQGIAIVAAGFGQNFVLTTVSTFILVYLLQYAQVSTGGIAVVTIVLTATKILDAVADPIMGSIIDRTRTRWGKLRPFILISALPVALLSGLLFSVPNVDEPLQLLYFGIVYTIWGLAYTVCDVPFWGLIGSAFADAPTRTRVIGMVRAFGAIALGLATLGMPWLARLFSGPTPEGVQATSSGWSIAVFVTSFAGMALFLLAFAVPRERVLAVERLSFRQLFGTLFKNTPLLMVLIGSAVGFGRFIVQSGGAVFVVIAYGDEGTFTLIGAAIIAGLVLASFGTPFLLKWMPARTLVIGSSLIAALLYVAMFVVGFGSLTAVLVFIFLTGLTLGVFLVVQATMIADSVDDVERRTGVRNDGISFATLTFVSKIMNALAIMTFGIFVVIAGYQNGVDVTPEMQGTIWAAITIVPAISCVLSVIPFWFYKLSTPPPAPVEERAA